MKTTVNQRLGIFLDYMKISQEDYRVVVGVKKQQVSAWLTSKEDVPDKHLFKTIEMYPQLNARWLLTGDGKMEEEEQKGAAEESATSYKVQIGLMQKVMELQEKYVIKVEHENEELRKNSEPKKEIVSESSEKTG